MYKAPQLAYFLGRLEILFYWTLDDPLELLSVNFSFVQKSNYDHRSLRIIGSRVGPISGSGPSIELAWQVNWAQL